MTLQEMSVEYRAQARTIQGRIQTLKQDLSGEEETRARADLRRRIWDLSAIWRETRDQAVLLERYYERGYRHNGKYTI